MNITPLSRSHPTNLFFYYSAFEENLRDEQLQPNDLRYLIQTIQKSFQELVNLKYNDSRTSKKSYSTSHSFSLELKENSLIIQIFGKRLLGEGSYKKVKPSYKFTLTPPVLTSLSSITLSSITFKKRARIIIQNPNALDNAEKGIKNLKSIPDYHKFNIAGIFTNVKTYTTPQKIKIEAEDLLYDQSFKQALEAMPVPVDLDSIFKNLYQITECCTFLAHIHHHGFVHGDFKADNLLLLNDYIYIGDFDLTTRQGLKDLPTLRQAFIYWNKLSHWGIFTPLSDLHGLSILIGQSVFGVHEFNKQTNFEKTDITEEALDSLLINPYFLENLIKIFQKTGMNCNELILPDTIPLNDQFNIVINFILAKLNYPLLENQQSTLYQQLKIIILRKKTLQVIKNIYHENKRYEELVDKDPAINCFYAAFESRSLYLKSINENTENDVILKNYQDLIYQSLETNYPTLTTGTFTKEISKQLTSLMQFSLDPLSPQSIISAVQIPQAFNHISEPPTSNHIDNPIDLTTNRLSNLFDLECKENIEGINR